MNSAKAISAMDRPAPQGLRRQGSLRSALRKGGWLGLGVLVGVPIVIAALALAKDLSDPYYRAPTPDGLVVRIQVGEVTNPIERITVYPAPDGSSKLLIHNPFAGNQANSDDPAWIEVDYPTGATRLTSAEGSDVSPYFDFDGDGVEDRVQVPEGLSYPPDYDVVRVIFGADGTTLFSQRDPFEYANQQRAFPLGDLDGDGFGELALVHPRRNRAYDFHPADWFLHAKSWVTVVSGARL